MFYDVFICHAAEDKDNFVRPLAGMLKKQRVEVWYDEFSLKVGDSLRRSIDRGLSKSRYGIVVLSPHFFSKNWTEYELDGLVQRQNSSSKIVILPIWHNVDHDRVLSYSPPLADKFAIPSNVGLDEVVKRLLDVIRPNGSTLLIARDILMDFGYEPPVVTDDWWLDVVEKSVSNPVEDTFQSASGWGRWGFPLPLKGEIPEERGYRLAWAAMQGMWRERAEAEGITQVTHPNALHAFIASNCGLRETCHDYTEYLIAYAPQLTIRGYGGEFEEEIESMYQESLNSHMGKKTGCDVEFALRHPQFGNHEPSSVACWFVQGDLMGPEVKAYDFIEYIAWLLSSDSLWLTEPIRSYLTTGMKEWAIWPSFERLLPCTHKFAGSLLERLYKATDFDSFELNHDARQDLEFQFSMSIEKLGLMESPSRLVDLFLENGFIEAWFVRG
ncbi:MAG TPA: hypothetical protein DF292_03885 [Firmicutes bacterium]|jgi:hypothetical protein|nr:hypothetical protein [Bacillota bacterium]HCT36159.1 hypothetical protein [Bacillota bacterium]